MSYAMSFLKLAPRWFYRSKPILFKTNLLKYCTIYDNNFNYFRSRPEYKNFVVQLSDCSKNVADRNFSFVINESIIQADGLFSHLQQRDNVMKLSSNQVKEILCVMANSQIDTSKHSLALKFLDEKCALSVERWPLDLSFYILDAWFIILGPKTFRKYYYSAVKSQWSRRMRKCSKFNLILMLYFIGMSKTSPPFLMELIEDRMESYALDFSDEEYAIACLSFFKTSKKLSSDVILQQSCIAASNLLIKNDRFNVISILKCLRLSKYYNEQLWSILQDYIAREYNTFNFVECTNFLAVFATQKIYNKELYCCLEDHGIAVLTIEKHKLLEENTKLDSKVHPSKKSRVKDLARYLWAFSSVGHVLKSSSLNFMSEEITSRLHFKEFEQQLHIAIDILQSFALMGYYPENILKSLLVSSTLKKVLYLDMAKPKYQLYFVQKSVNIESPGIVIDESARVFNNPIPKSLEKDIKERKGFQDLISYLKKIPNIDFKCCYLIPHIMIASIVLRTDNCSEEENKTFSIYQKYLDNGNIFQNFSDFLNEGKVYSCIEVLDESVCKQSTSIPLGLMETKIRQLKCLNFDVITLTTEDIIDIINSNKFDYKEGVKMFFR